MLNLSFSGCGFLGIYHLGVVSAFKEHAPEYIQGKISGCSAGSLVAAAAACDCCLGQMVSDVLEIALKARSHALGPLHPSFSIVDILRNGLRRILPIDAHKICSGRVFISLTRWKDGKNVLVSQYDTREELIQALICSSFVPVYSGFIPPKFKGTYYWDGGLTNNHPILDEDTILVSPFGGESDICPRDETASYYTHDFQGTNLHLSYENIYRISRALFPPSPQILKAMCFRGYKDAVNFLKSRNLLSCSCNRLIKEKNSISSVFGEDLHGYSVYDGDDMLDKLGSIAYESDEDNIIQYAQSNEPLDYQEMPESVCKILDTACNDEAGIINYVVDSNFSKFISIMVLPWTLSFEFSMQFTKRFFELLPKIQVPTSSSSLYDSILIYVDLIIQKLTYDKYHYHARVACKFCVTTNGYNVCRHNEASGKLTINSENSSQVDKFTSFSHSSYQPKLCARHRVPSVCSSEATNTYRLKKSNRNRSNLSNASDLTSSVDLNEFKSSKLFNKRRRMSTYSTSTEASKNHHGSQLLRVPSNRSKSLIKSNNSTTLLSNSPSNRASMQPPQGKVHFHLCPPSDEDDHVDTNEEENVNVNQIISAPVVENTSTGPALTTTTTTTTITTTTTTVAASLSSLAKSKADLLNKINGLNDQSNGMKRTGSSAQGNEWDYWDNLELNVVGKINNNT